MNSFKTIGEENDELNKRKAPLHRMRHSDRKRNMNACEADGHSEHVDGGTQTQSLFCKWAIETS